MAEVYPSDNELLNITADSETGVEYIATGRAPYYLEFRKLIYRLLLACRRANDLRLFSEGQLNVGVKKGRFWLANTLVIFAGSSGDTLADDKSSIYLYIDAQGQLVTDEYSSFPDMADQPHLRLAIATTSGGQITSITDCRDCHTFSIPFGAGGIKKTIQSHTADATVTESQSGSVHSNLGTVGPVTITLPTTAAEGTQFTFTVQEAFELRIEPGTAAAIRDSSGQDSGKYKYANSIGDSVSLVADENGNWAVTAKTGNWQQEA